MSQRAQRRTVVAYTRTARYQLERALAAAIKCDQITGDEWREMRHAYRTLDHLVARLKIKRAPRKR